MFSDDTIKFKYSLNRVIQAIKKEYGLEIVTEDFIKMKVKTFIKDDIGDLLESTFFDKFFKFHYTK